MTSHEDLSSEEKIRSALHRDVNAICTETCHNLGFSIQRASVAIIAELVYKKLLMYGSDLEAFAKHAKRSIINTDDVKLLVRGNPSLVKLVMSKGNAGQVQKRRATAPNMKFESQPKKPKVNKIKTERDYANFPSTSDEICDLT